MFSSNDRKAPQKLPGQQVTTQRPQSCCCFASASGDRGIVGTQATSRKENFSKFALRVLCLLRVWKRRKELVQVI